MCPPATDPLADISIHCTREELFTSLAKMNRGCPLPGNVIADLNPFCNSPQHLPENIWYFLPLKENKVTQDGFWIPRGEPLNIFSDASICGWETTHEFYEVQAPHCFKTDWLILEYKITTKGLVNDAITKEASSLCKVSRNNDRLPQHGVEQTADKKDAEKGSTSGQLQVPDDLSRELFDMIEGGLDYDLDYFSQGDYIELQDLVGTPSSSDNSSCISMSSGECFDALPPLQDLEAEYEQKLKRKDADMKFAVSDSAQPLNIALAANSALTVEASFLEHYTKDGKAASSKGELSSSSPNAGSSSSRQSPNGGTSSSRRPPSLDGKLKDTESKSSSSCSQSPNGGTSSSRQPPSPGGKPKDRGSKRLKRLTKNLFCFMAF